LNSVLQSLSSLNSFQNYVKVQAAQLAERKLDFKAWPLTQALKDTLEKLVTSKERSFNPSIVLKVPKLKTKFPGKEQQDAHELMQFVMSSLDDEVTINRKPQGFGNLVHSSSDFGPSSENMSSSFSRIPSGNFSWKQYHTKINPFLGLFESTLRNLQCNHLSITHQKFMDISLSIPRRNSKVTLQDCLKFFTKAEKVLDVECSTCGKDKIKGAAEKQLLIARPPQTLCLHIRRLVMDLPGRLKKMEDHIEFPSDLDLSPYCQNYSSTQQDLKQPHLPKTVLDLFSSNPNKLSVVPPNLPLSTSLWYKLNSVIVHHGNQAGGHYAVYRKLARENSIGPSDADWVYISDEYSRGADWIEVAKAKAYMLYYEKCDTVTRNY